MSKNKQSNTSNDLFGLFYKLTRNIFFAYIIIVVLGVLAVVGYGYVMYAHFGDSELWEYMGSLIS